MSLRHILLGLLKEPHSGYDLKKQFDRSLRNFWRAELSQIYPLLQKMETEGLLSSRASESDIGPTRRVYKRTARGRRALLDWLNDGPVVNSERIEYLAQTYFLAELEDDDAILRFLEELRDYLSDRLETLERIATGWAADDPAYPDELDDENFYAQLTLDLGLRRIKATVDWCNASMRRLKDRRQ